MTAGSRGEHHGEYQTVDHALKYLALADKIPHRVEGESALLEEVPAGARGVLDLGTGDGRLLSLVLLKCPGATGLGVDFSPTMLEAARRRFGGVARVTILHHDLAEPLKSWGTFDVICSSLAIHHVSHARKRELYREVLEALEPGGVFLNLEHVESPTPALHSRFLQALGIGPEEEDKSNILLDVHTQLVWLRGLGYEDVDCLWKWRELALLAGKKPSASRVF